MHWYSCPIDGPIETRYDSDLREARKHGYFCSVTTIEKQIRANPRLADWIQEETVKACCEYPRAPWEDDKSYFERIKKAASKIADTAADFGTRLHDAVEQMPQIPIDPEIRPYFDKYAAWHEENIQETISCEEMIANHEIGVAGKVDRIAVHRKHGKVVIDYKTQKIKLRPNFYLSWVRQLSFYAKSYSDKYDCDQPRVLSLAINSASPSDPVEKLWSFEEQAIGWEEFVCQAYLWSLERDYWPSGRWNIAEVLSIYEKKP